VPDGCERAASSSANPAPTGEEFVLSRLALLLRGINVGGNNKVAMADLKRILGDLGYTDCKTLLNSGNAVVTTDDEPAKAEKRVTAAIKQELGLSIDVMARTHDELAAVVKANPLKAVATNPKYSVVAFLHTTPAQDALDDIDPKQYAPECWKLVGRELFIWFANGQGKTKLPANLFDKRLKTPATARNWNTVVKLLELTA
jgi:uncharacterized protein (DUF1697 family)